MYQVPYGTFHHSPFPPPQSANDLAPVSIGFDQQKIFGIITIIIGCDVHYKDVKKTMATPLPTQDVT